MTQARVGSRHVLVLVCVGSGGWIRTTDLRVMSPTSCHCSTPRRSREAGGSRLEAGQQAAVCLHQPLAARLCAVVHRPTLPAGLPPVPSALRRFTFRFGMGRGGATALHAHHWLKGVHSVARRPTLRSAFRPALSLGKPSSMRSARLHPSRGFQRQPLAQSSPGGLTWLYQ